MKSAVTTLEEQKGFSGVVRLQAQNLSRDNGVVAAVIFAPKSAFGPGDDVVKERTAQRPGAPPNACEFIRTGPGEPTADRILLS